VPFYKRWRILEDEVINPRNNEKSQFESGTKSNPLYKYDTELFSVSGSKIADLLFHFHKFWKTHFHFSYYVILYQVRRKAFWLLHTVKDLLTKFIPSLPHGADGLILQVLTSYLVGYFTTSFGLWPLRLCFLFGFEGSQLRCFTTN
jgi:mRNA-capping enzyme